ncbi:MULTISPECIES: gamma-butyrolactone-binding regulator SlbR [Streptomyces]|uniref:Regulatory protein n=1 Tax=Streptomyces coelicolor (strain ATCC BAA-471 / A3(2) / M145) TaxID=100226 RepID=Q9RJN6_STRCO|nr:MULTISPECIES: gamma-butyrolactone-binding regulator SlbR [Streptomyces]MDX2922970.1 gamma-butyrolactone-binding regulator SlbR [Streptomyces sp. NRRL_B-16638]MDX3316551.1 gamma-butyrolactone-binding regulator SlbR [Streptomyces sp. ME03-5684b]MDX3406771.1 gamma-butyrolactone-binding regulator SlbR [Streptomyces sp. ME02-6977A]MYU40134.1 gamma-butyrolactone-binding regulator SlbR [Streptomyces sp. SID7813]NSL79669.1 gamma-butyrolactone-binding regulator SlbR [Streptomyces coelicolor]
MSESTMQSATELASQYSVQVTDDLERNVKEQERVSTEITALQQQLAALQHDHALLVNMQQALGITPQPARSAPEPASSTGAATVPAPRGSAAAQSETDRRTRGRKTTTAPKRAAAAKPGAKPASKPKAKKATKSTATATTKATTKATAKTDKPADPKADPKPSTKTGTKTAPDAVTTAPATSAAKPAGKPAAKKAAARATAQPTLVELVREHLVGQREPRSAAEVTTALSEAHSGRTVKTTVVRTTLEGLVAKNQAQRTKQGTSVYYTATETPASEPKQEPAAGTQSARNGS